MNRLFGLSRKGGLSLVPLLFFSVLASAMEWRINEGSFNAQLAPQLTGNDDKVWVSHADTEGRLLIRAPEGKPIPLNAGSQQGSPSGLTVTASGNRLYAVWRERRERKFVLVFRSSRDNGNTWDEEVIIDQVTLPLTRIVVQGDEQGHVCVAWLGQREDSLAPVIGQDEDATTENQGRKHYHIYARYSADGGKTWRETRRLTVGYAESIWPTLLTRGEKAYSLSWSQRDGKKYIIFTKTNETGDWQTPTVVREVGDVLILKPYWIGTRLLAIWLSKPQNGEWVIEGAFSDDEQAWTPFVLDDTRGSDIATIEVATQQQNVYLTFSARLPANPDKQTVYFTRSTDGGKTWDKIKILRHYPFPDTTALYPKILAGPGATVAVIWNDYRNIRGDLYLNYSLNAGADWLSNDIPIDIRGLDNSYLYPFSSAFARTGNYYYVLSGRYHHDIFSGPTDLILNRFELKQPEYPMDLLGDIGSSEKVSLLRKNAIHLWESLVQGDYKVAYPLFDPFFRTHFREVDYLAATGRIIYHSFQIGDITVHGNVGRVAVSYEYEIPEFITKQGKFSRPRTQASVVENWVFVTDNWYKEYRNEMSGATYTRY